MLHLFIYFLLYDPMFPSFQEKFFHSLVSIHFIIDHTIIPIASILIAVTFMYPQIVGKVDFLFCVFDLCHELFGCELFFQQ